MHAIEYLIGQKKIICEDSKLEMLYIHKIEFLSIAFKLDQM
jgi:hypothetical protein